MQYEGWSGHGDDFNELIPEGSQPLVASYRIRAVGPFAELLLNLRK